MESNFTFRTNDNGNSYTIYHNGEAYVMLLPVGNKFRIKSCASLQNGINGFLVNNILDGMYKVRCWSKSDYKSMNQTKPQLEEFNRVYKQWRDNSGMCSVFGHAKQQEGYKELYNMGIEAVPYIMAELNSHNGGMHTMFLLREILGGFWPAEFPNDGRFNVEQCKKDWCYWWFDI